MSSSINPLVYVAIDNITFSSTTHYILTFFFCCLVWEWRETHSTKVFASTPAWVSKGIYTLIKVCDEATMLIFSAGTGEAGLGFLFSFLFFSRVIALGEYKHAEKDYCLSSVLQDFLKWLGVFACHTG